MATLDLAHAELLALVTGARSFAELEPAVEGDADAAARLFEILGL